MSWTLAIALVSITWQSDVQLAVSQHPDQQYFLQNVFCFFLHFLQQQLWINIVTYFGLPAKQMFSVVQNADVLLSRHACYVFKRNE